MAAIVAVLGLFDAAMATVAVVSPDGEFRGVPILVAAGFSVLAPVVVRLHVGRLLPPGRRSAERGR